MFLFVNEIKMLQNFTKCCRPCDVTIMQVVRKKVVHDSLWAKPKPNFKWNVALDGKCGGEYFECEQLISSNSTC